MKSMHQFAWYVSFKGEKPKNLRAFGAVPTTVHNWCNKFLSVLRTNNRKIFMPLAQYCCSCLRYPISVSFRDEKPTNLNAFGTVLLFIIEMTNFFVSRMKSPKIDTPSAQYYYHNWNDQFLSVSRMKNCKIFAPLVQYYCSWLK